LEPGHLKTESDFKKHYVRRGNPRDPRNRERLRELLGEVMIRNTRGLVNINLPARYAQTLLVEPGEDELRLYQMLETYLRERCAPLRSAAAAKQPSPEDDFEPAAQADLFSDEARNRHFEGAADSISTVTEKAAIGRSPLPAFSRMQVNALLAAAGSHPAALLPTLTRCAAQDERARPLAELAGRLGRSAKEEKLLSLLRKNPNNKALIFTNFRATLDRLRVVLTESGLTYTVFSGAESAAEKARAMTDFREHVPIMLCSESGGEGHNLQFCNTLVNFDLPWNPMRIEQRVGRIHRFGQTREVFVFNLCTTGSLEARILKLLHDKIRMFELVVGEVGSILGNLEGGDEFESLVLNLWLRAKDGTELDGEFDRLGEALLQAQDEYLKTKELDAALFGEDFE
jgi:SNF2 family DNA or RNA helicase